MFPLLFNSSKDIKRGLQNVNSNPKGALSNGELFLSLLEQLLTLIFEFLMGNLTPWP
jgi:hypothetical protein